MNRHHVLDLDLDLESCHVGVALTFPPKARERSKSLPEVNWSSAQPPAVTRSAERAVRSSQARLWRAKVQPSVDSTRALCAEEPRDRAEGTLWAAWANLVATCVGSSIVLVPSMVAHLGLVGASLALLLPAVQSAATMRILVKLADASWEANDYTGVIREFLGRTGDWIAFAAMVVLLPLVTASCIEFAVELVPHAFASVSPLAAGALAVAVAAPFACTTSLQRLSSASTFGIAAILYTILVIVVQGFTEGDHSPPALVVTRINLYFIIISQCLSAFGGELAVIQLYFEVSQERRCHFIRWAIDGSLLVILTMYLFVAVMGYVLFGSDVQTDVLLNLTGGGVWSSIAEAAVVVSNVLRAPLFCVIFYVTIASKFPNTFKRLEGWRAVRLSLQVGCLLLAATAALCLRSVGIVLAIMGGTAGVALFQVMPSLGWLLARRDGKLQRHLALDAGACVMIVGFPLFSVAFVVALVRELAGVM